MTHKRKLGIAAIVAAAVGVSLMLNYHKDLIQAYNIRLLREEGLDGRLLTHRVNDRDKLRAVLSSGLRSFETDMQFRSGEERYFEIGHDRDSRSGIRFDEFLALTDTGKARKIWMDIKNLDESSIDAALAELMSLDTAYGIKGYTVVESSTQSSAFRRIRSAGFHTSYYLPTSRLLELQSGHDTLLLREEARRIGVQVDSQGAAAVSFDLRLYPFVKEYLEAEIGDSVAYHVWGGVKMWQWGVLQRLKQTAYYADPRVKSILFYSW